MTKIIYFDVEQDEYNYLKNKNDGNYEYFLIDKALNKLEKLPVEYRDADIISCFTTSRIDEIVLGQFSNLKLIALRSVGYNHVDLEYCKENGIAVVNTPNYGNKSVAEFAFGLMLDVCRKITKAYLEFRDVKQNHQVLIGSELGGKIVGIIGLGAIGKEFAKLAHGFEMNILGYDLVENQQLKEAFDVKYVGFETLLSQSDFISLHAPLTTNNYHLFNSVAFSKMKKSAVLVNTARGELIDTQALYNAITQGEIAGAGLDVLESEEAISDSDYLIDIGRLNNCALRQTILNTRLQQLDNVVITPHIAYNTHEAIDRILETTMSNIKSFVTGNLQNSVY